MATFYLEDFSQGQVIELGPVPTVSEEEIMTFARQWDPQPFHTDPVAAKETIYGGLIASGWHTALLTMRVMVDKLLNHTAALGSPGVENIRFLKPVRAGDRLTARYTVLMVEPSVRRPTRGKILGRTEVLDDAGNVVYSMDGWTLIERGTGQSTLS